MEDEEIEVAARAVDSFPITRTMESNPVSTRRKMLGITSMASLAAATSIAPGAFAQTAQKRPRIACLVSYWGLPTSHADWIVNKLIDGYWWKGAHTPSRVDVASVFVHQLETSLLAQKVCKAKDIPIFKTVGEAVTLGGKDLAVDGVVIVAEHGFIGRPVQHESRLDCAAGQDLLLLLTKFGDQHRAASQVKEEWLYVVFKSRHPTVVAFRAYIPDLQSCPLMATTLHPRLPVLCWRNSTRQKTVVAEQPFRYRMIAREFDIARRPFTPDADVSY